MVFNRPEATMLFDTLKVSCEKLAEKDGEFKFQLQSFVKEHSSVNGLVTMDTVKSLYDMILDNARSYLPGKIEQDNARVDKIFTDGCYLCGSLEHWRRECPQATGQHGKGKTKSLSKGQGKGKPPGTQPLGAGKGKGQKGKRSSKGKGKNKNTPKAKELKVAEEDPEQEGQGWDESQGWPEFELDWNEPEETRTEVKTEEKEPSS